MYPNFDPPRPVHVFYKEITLNGVPVYQLIVNDKVLKATIDILDYDLIKYAQCWIDGYGYVIIKLDFDHSPTKLHRFLLDPDESEDIDHKDGNPGNNCRSNLRITDHTGNMQNCKKRKDCTSIYIGVAKIETKWASYIDYDKHYNLGYFDQEEYAGRKRDLFVLENCKDACFRMNFVWTEEDILLWNNLIYIDENKPKNTTSIYYGVTKNRNSWVAQINIDKTHQYLGSFDNEEYAARHRDLHILENCKDTSKFIINFEWNEEEISKWKELIFNELNKPKDAKFTSKYVGVRRYKETWFSSCEVNKKLYRLGYFDIEEHAGRTRDLFILEKFNNIGRKLNFNWDEETIIKWKQLLSVPDDSKV